MALRDIIEWFMGAPAPQASAATYKMVLGTGGDGGVLTYAPAVVSPETAMRHSAVFRAVSLISGTIAMLPLNVYKRQGDGDRELALKHPASRLLLQRPNNRMSRTVFWRQMISQALLAGNGVAWIQRQQSGAPKALWPIPWSRVSTQLVGQRIRYHLTLDDGTSIEAWEDDVLHIPGSPEWVDTYAKTPISAYADAVGIGLEANRFARKYFENDATPSGYISYPNKLAAGTNQADEIRNYWRQKFGGDNRHSGPAVLTDGGEFKQLSIKAEDAQLLETRRFQIEDIARVFGVPRFLLAMDETSWGSGIEQLGIFFVRYTLAPHLQAIRDECDWKLFGTDQHFCDFDPSELLKGDTKSMFEAVRLSIGGSSGPGIKTQNEWRKEFNLPRVDDPAADKLTTWNGTTPDAPAPQPPAG